LNRRVKELDREQLVPCLAQLLSDRRVMERGLRYFVDILGSGAKPLDIYLQVVMFVSVSCHYTLPC
jgi:hypothetical protein